MPARAEMKDHVYKILDLVGSSEKRRSPKQPGGVATDGCRLAPAQRYRGRRI